MSAENGGGLPNSLFSIGSMDFGNDTNGAKKTTDSKDKKIHPVDISSIPAIDIEEATVGSDTDGNRNWRVVLYPDSVPPNWREYLDSLNLQWYESPLHEHDMSADGSPKKPHWHLVFCFEGKKSYKQLLRILKPLNGPIPKVADNLRGAVRYLAHIDNPEKYQYPASQIICHGGADLEKYLVADSYHRKILLREMQAYVRANNIFEFADLMDYAAQERFEDWYQLLIDNSAMVMDKYICSLRNSIKDQFIVEREIFHKEKNDILVRLGELEKKEKKHRK